MLDKYIYGAHGALVVYDVTNSGSFDDLVALLSLPVRNRAGMGWDWQEDWVRVVRQMTEGQEKPPHLALVGNKTDLEHLRVVRIEKHTKFAENNSMSSHYVSGKTGDSVRLLFRFVPLALLLSSPQRRDGVEGRWRRRSWASSCPRWRWSRRSPS